MAVVCPFLATLNRLCQSNPKKSFWGKKITGVLCHLPAQSSKTLTVARFEMTQVSGCHHVVWDGPNLARLLLPRGTASVSCLFFERVEGARLSLVSVNGVNVQTPSICYCLSVWFICHLFNSDAVWLPPPHWKQTNKKKSCVRVPTFQTSPSPPVQS